MIKDYALEALRLIFFILSFVLFLISLYLSYDLAINYNDDFVICFLLVMAVAFMLFLLLGGVKSPLQEFIKDFLAMPNGL
ncbi:putative membrane protein [Campylobacter hyointestinalis subsp. lawsonii CCUG 27631]|nr:putative membrane protein [Campylobacter hyointestinalis subsp. lawsonii CCUG 27631]